MQLRKELHSTISLYTVYLLNILYTHDSQLSPTVCTCDLHAIALYTFRLLDSQLIPYFSFIGLTVESYLQESFVHWTHS